VDSDTIQAVTTAIIEVGKGSPEQGSANVIVAMKDKIGWGKGSVQAVQAGVHHETSSQQFVGRIGAAGCHRQCSIVGNARVV
jgi:hypothetical protein